MAGGGRVVPPVSKNNPAARLIVFGASPLASGRGVRVGSGPRGFRDEENDEDEDEDGEDLNDTTVESLKAQVGVAYAIASLAKAAVHCMVVIVIVGLIEIRDKDDYYRETRVLVLTMSTAGV